MPNEKSRTESAASPPPAGNGKANGSASSTTEVIEEAAGAPVAVAPALAQPAEGTNGHANGDGGARGEASGQADGSTEVIATSGDSNSYTPRALSRSRKGVGIKFPRRLSRAGADVFDSIEWEKRTASITGEDGKAVFTQENCDIPKPWSQLATNVVVSKYFRGPLDSPRRETSVRQVIGRVAGTIHRWGREGRYFASDEDAQAFHDELAYLLLHQYGSFNSPVWFNIGVDKARQQASACFINSVHDNMESIMELASTEARLFKGGSGAGTNLWRVRSSKEHLSGGGIASGPVSFMRGWDSFAGAIKCLTPDAQVLTDGGLKRLDEIISPNLSPGFHQDESIVLATKDGATRISHVYVSPEAPTRRATLRHTGLSLRGTHEHPVLTLTRDIKLEWKTLADLAPGDRVAVSRRDEMWPEAAPRFSFEPDNRWAKKTLSFPDEMTPELARLLGYMVSEGCMDAERFRFCNADADVFQDFLACVESVFGVDPRPNARPRLNEKTGVTTWTFEACWANAVRFLAHVGLGTERSGEKKLPCSIRQSPRALVVEFLRAYFEGDGHVSTHVYASSASKYLLGEIQLLLLNMGMVPLLRRHPVNGKDYWSLYLRGEEAWKFVREVGFVSARKQAASEQIGDKNLNTNIDTVPFLVDALRKRCSGNKYFSCSDGSVRALSFGFFNRLAGSSISYKRLRNTPGLLDSIRLVEPAWAQVLEHILEREFFWDAVASVENDEPSVTYDFTVPGTHSFVANGIVNHNSGGTTRRAAKMVILNADHPDIRDFIVCKADEERKAWALIDAGYPGGFNVPGGAYDSVAFQNANHSVRATDAFMRAAENGMPWSTRAVTSGEPVETFNAKDLLMQIAESTHVCGDPGLQYDSTINDWHTCANTDRIHASNPCCVTGDTLVAVADGRNAVPIRELVGAEVPVYAHDHSSGRTVTSRMWNIGIKRENVPVYRVTLDDGSSFRATDDHLIMLRDGSYRMVRDLRPSDSLMPFHSSLQVLAGLEKRVVAGEHTPQLGAEAGLERDGKFRRCCPVCRSNFDTAREDQLLCSLACRFSPMGMEMMGSGNSSGAASTCERNRALKSARLMLDQGIVPSLPGWNDAELREQAALWNHKVLAVELCGHEDVYDGTVDTHHNFAILTSSEDSCVPEHQNYSGLFIHNSEFVFLDDTACLPQETRISTPSGLRTIGELYASQQAGEEVHVTTDLVSEHDQRRLASHRRAWVTLTGRKPVFKIALADGRRVRATGNHRFLTDAGEWKRVDELAVGADRIALRQQGNTVAFSSHEEDVARWRMLGWMSGDGVFSRGATALVFGPHEEETARVMEAEFNRLLGEAIAYKRFVEPAQVLAGGIEENVLPRGGCHISRQANGVLQINSKSQPLCKYLQEWYGMSEALATGKDAPSKVHHVADDLKVAYLQGLFSADGCIRCDARGSNEEVMLASSSPEMLRTVQLMLGDLGIASRIGWAHPSGRKNPQGQLHIYNQQARTFLSLIGFACSASKQARAEEILSRPFEGALKNPRPAKVISIEPDGVEDVFDITEPVTHSFIAEGMVTHNCNLASLNLMRFRDEAGAFDSELFIHACETFITAQEILVSNASYPTEKIARNSEDYRPLGLGYANLGALLMAQGTAYDSDDGRALAGAITAVMTGSAYAQSARIAANVGPFNGYSQNREPMLRVIRKHRDAVQGIRRGLVPPDLMDAAQRVWDQALVLGEKHGFRNAQATVLAPTGCLIGGSLVSTDRGLVRLDTLGNPNGEAWQHADFAVQTDEGPQRATKFFINGVEATRKIQTEAGYTIQGTLKHRVKVVDGQSGEWAWKRFAEIQAGDVVPLAMNGLIGEAREVILPPLGDLHWNGDFQTVAPRRMSAELAEFVGYFMGDGSLHAKGLRLCVAEHDADVAERLQVLARELFGLEAHLSTRQGYVEVAVHSVPLAIWWDACGFGKARPHAEHSGKGWSPRVPDAVLHSNDARVYGAFLRGLFEADGTLIEGVPSLSTACEEFACEVRSILLILGFPTTSKAGASGWGSKILHSMRLRNSSYNARFRNEIGFMGQRKSAATLEVKDGAMAKRDRIPLSLGLIDELAPCGHPLRDSMMLSMRRHNMVSRSGVMALFAQTGDERLRQALDFFYDAVVSNEDGGERETFDLSVPSNVSYVANGFVSHNTIAFMMDCDTTGIEPDIALVKYKKLVGGGLLKIVNQTVPEALRRLGYSGDEMRAVVEYIDKNDTIEGAPALRDDDLSVFDCAFKAMNGTRSIHYMGHIKMMAAAQPFLSGAISKTVNLPQDCVIEDIYNAYLESWKLGVKAVAIYRDGSKRTQPLSTSQDKKPGEITAEAPKPYRRKLPDERASITHKFSIAGQEGYFMVGLFDDGSPGEIFIKMNKEGSTISGLMDSFAISISMALQYGVPLRVLVNKFTNTRFEPAGYTTNREIPIAKSLMDYIFRWFDQKFHPNGTNGSLHKSEPSLLEASAADDEADSKNARRPEALAPRAAPASTSRASNGAGANGTHAGDLTQGLIQAQTDAPPCSDCGSLMIRAGACYKCPDCGTTSGCG